MNRATTIDRFRRRRKLFVGTPKGRTMQVSLKGIALLCAIDAGMIEETPSGDCDVGPFLRFWNEFSKFIPADRRGYPGEVQNVIKLRQEEKGE